MKEDDGAVGALEDHAQTAADALERSLLKAVGNVEAELSRVLRTGESELDRLARMAAEVLAKLVVDGVAGPAPGSADAAGSLNQIAAAVVRAARRGARFT